MKRLRCHECKGTIPRPSSYYNGETLECSQCSRQTSFWIELPDFEKEERAKKLVDSIDRLIRISSKPINDPFARAFEIYEIKQEMVQLLIQED